jgi:hypothetical protein
MGNKYPGVSTSGYNASPPSDDNAQTANNQITWAGIKSKLADVLKTFGEAINTAVAAALDYSTNTQSSTYSTVAADHDKIIQVTASFTVTALLAATGGAGYRFGVSNQHTAAISVARSSTDTFNGSATSWTIQPGQTVWFYANAALNGYLVNPGANQDSGGAITDKKRASVYQYTAWDPSDVAGTLTNASNSAAATLAAADYVTAANSSGTLTFTCVKAGVYRFTITGINEFNNAITAANFQADIGGTGTIYLGTTTLKIFSYVNGTLQPMSGTGVFYAAMTASQTITILPKFSVSSGGVTTQFTQQCTVACEYTGT